MTAPRSPPPHGLSLPVRWSRVIDGETIEALLPSGRSVVLRIEGFHAPNSQQSDGLAAKHALELLLEETADSELTAFIPLPDNRDKNGKLDLDEPLKAFAFERLRAHLFAGSIRVDLWMIEHGHVK